MRTKGGKKKEERKRVFRNMKAFFLLRYCGWQPRTGPNMPGYESLCLLNMYVLSVFIVFAANLHEWPYFFFFFGFFHSIYANKINFLSATEVE